MAKAKVTAKGLTQLGQPVKLPASPDEAVLESAPNPQAGTDYLIRFTAPEFTSLCPMTGQPDFAHLVIDYVPNQMIVPRGLHGGDRQAHRGGDQAEMAAHRGLLVSARRHPDRRVLADRHGSQRSLGARPGRPLLSRTRLRVVSSPARRRWLSQPRPCRSRFRRSRRRNPARGPNRASTARGPSPRRFSTGAASG